MSYCMMNRGCDFTILKQNIPGALQAIQTLMDEAGELGTGVTSAIDANGERRTHRYFRGVDDQAVRSAITLEAALQAWDWAMDCDEQGNVCAVWYDGNNAGDEECLWDALAPFVKPESYIEMSGEDGYIWRWVFLPEGPDGEMICMEIPATITFGS
jgi:hypothetical protein